MPTLAGPGAGEHPHQAQRSQHGDRHVHRGNSADLVAPSQHRRPRAVPPLECMPVPSEPGAPASIIPHTGWRCQCRHRHQPGHAGSPADRQGTTVKGARVITQSVHRRDERQRPSAERSCTDEPVRWLGCAGRSARYRNGSGPVRKPGPDPAASPDPAAGYSRCPLAVRPSGLLSLGGNRAARGRSRPFREAGRPRLPVPRDAPEGTDLLSQLLSAPGWC